ncbi:MAG: 2-oxoacid:ferredoxin oxidoreductase subunit beta [Betaproteobacteria bacterium]|nr:2-oxoacid:ferredoxin oxidoreductase subunit beta [Betaproteobacteria bacterium]MBL8533899.1 2-oxoacid:ferredoxin oxidoreductase subunit beta [Betaproteobacteria bacterium]
MECDVNEPVTKAFLAKDFKSDVKPIWCPGCGDFGVVAALERAFVHLGRPPEQIAVVSGIGCSSRLPAYTAAYGFHGVHGRALPFAIGLKTSRPDLEVIAVGGDGDGYSIGGNHFLHACRRNVDLLYIVMDNHVYGMTKGQPSPTTEPDWVTDIAPEGSGLHPINPLALAVAAGATYIGRGFAGDPNGLAKLIVDGIAWPGFSFIEVLSPCLTFRPEQKEWKRLVHPAGEGPFEDRARAAAALLSDDGFGLGLFFRGEPLVTPARPAATTTLDEIERRFAL